jgi:hypothetical protein
MHKNKVENHRGISILSKLSGGTTFFTKIEHKHLHYCIQNLFFSKICINPSQIYVIATKISLKQAKSDFLDLQASKNFLEQAPSFEQNRPSWPIR